MDTDTEELYDVYWSNPGYGWQYMTTLPKSEAQAEAKRTRANGDGAKIVKSQA